MNYCYKDILNIRKETPSQWDRYIILVSNIEKSRPTNESPPLIDVSLPIENSLSDISIELHVAMENKDLKSTKIWLQQLYIYTYQNIVSDLEEFRYFIIIPDIDTIAANEINVFDLEMRQIAIEIIYNLIKETTGISEAFIQFNTTQLLTNAILNNDTLTSLHFSALRCLKKFANHCENCQQSVCEEFPFDYIQKVLNELKETGVVNQIHIEIFTIFENISKFPLQKEFVEFCFDMFVIFMDYSDELLMISLLGISNLTHFQDPSSWGDPLKNSNLPIILSKSLDHRNFIIIQSTLLLIATIHQKKQYLPTFGLEKIIDKLHYQDDQNKVEKNSKCDSIVRYYAAYAISEIMLSGRKFIGMMIRNGFLEAFVDVFEVSSFDVKFELSRSITEIAINGNTSEKLSLVRNGFVPYFIEMIELGNDKDIERLINSLGFLFSEVYNDPYLKKICYNSFYQTPNNSSLIDLIESPNESIRDLAVTFLDKFFPKA